MVPATMEDKAQAKVYWKNLKHHAIHKKLYHGMVSCNPVIDVFQVGLTKTPCRCRRSRKNPNFQWKSFPWTHLALRMQRHTQRTCRMLWMVSDCVNARSTSSNNVHKSHQNPKAPPAESRRFQRSTFLTFFSLMDPAQSIAKPTCMKKTRAPA